MTKERTGLFGLPSLASLHVFAFTLFTRTWVQRGWLLLRDNEIVDLSLKSIAPVTTDQTNPALV